MSFFAELKRRNVIRVGIAYVVVAWLVMQFSDVVLGNIEAPGWVFQVIMLVLAIGLPLVLVFAWAFEMTPEGLKKEKDVDHSQSIAPQTGKKLNNAILVLMAFAIAYLLYDKFSGPAQPGSDHFSQQTSGQTTDTNEKSALSPVGATDQPAQTISRQSIAVLPFDNRSPDANDAYFAEGIHDDLLTNLARIGSLKVISRTSVTQYKDTEKTIPQIAVELGVATIMEGAVQRSGDQVRINVQLIDAQTDEHLWAEIFDRELTAQNLFAIQSEISGAIAAALKATLTSDEQRQVNTVPTQNLRAYEAYMRGRQFMATREVAKLKEATGEFRAAVDLDPLFALAWVGVADSYNLLASYGSFNLEKALVIREDAVKHALAIDPGLGEAYASLATIHGDRGEYTAMESAYRKAIELSPNYATAYQWYGNVMTGLSRAQEAVDLNLKAAELDPRAAIIATSLGGAYANQGLLSRAEQQYRKVIELNPDFPQGYGSLGNFYAFYLGRFDLAIQNLRTALKMDPGSVNVLMFLAAFSLEIGDDESANQYRQAIADISDQDFRLGWADMLISQAQGNAEGIREAWKWTSSRINNYSFYSESAALFELAHGDPTAARRIYLGAEPGWIDPGSWGRLIDISPSTGCLVAWTFSKTGDEALGAALLDQTLAFFDKLPGLIEHVEVWDPQFCYLAAGDKEKALTTIETQLVNNFLFWRKTYDQLPMYEQIRFEPRYQAAMTERDRRLADQRAAVEQMTAESGL
jgi:TolB-like protein/Tfp pilus assembly protein PilF